MKTSKGPVRLHEDFGREREPKASSPRSFGFVMAVALPLLTGLFLREWWVAGLVVGGMFLITAILAPQMLAPLNRAWFRLGMVLSKIVSPLIMGLIFFLVVTPIGVARRLLGKHSMPLKADRAASSYWIAREPPGPDPQHLPRQF